MISFDLKCAHQHVFEIWFRSSADYAQQRERGLIACPHCGSVAVDKALMAPNIGKKGNQRPAPSALLPDAAADVPAPGPNGAAAGNGAGGVDLSIAGPVAQALAQLPADAAAAITAMARAQAES
ncbi:MAG: DUF1178 family protein, partial [Sphingopyxis sp.]